MASDESYRNLKRYVLLGSFLGGLIGATAALLLTPQSAEERKQKLMEMQGELFKPVKIKFAELVEYVGDSLIKALEEAAKKAGNGSHEYREEEEDRLEG